MKTPRAKTLFLLCLLLPFLSSLHAAVKESKPPDGEKVATGRHFQLYAWKKDTTQVKPGLTLYVFEMTAVLPETKRGRQLQRHRVESFSADLADPAMWQTGDFDGDGWDDYRFVSAVNGKGCRIWTTWRWLPERERFSLAAKLAYQTDAKGKAVKTCM